MANDVDKSFESTPLSKTSKLFAKEAEEGVKLNFNNNHMKMTPAASPPAAAIPSWAPILFPPWNAGLLPAAFYPAALRSLPK